MKRMVKKRIQILLAIGFLIMSHISWSQKYQEPQWEMPFYFEDALGQLDTIWIGYDPSASMGLWQIDPQFDEDWKWIDTTQFNVYLTYQGQHPDSVIKRDISSWPYLIGSNFRFTKGKLPVVMKWEEELLNSPNMPGFYSPVSPRPRARIDLMSGSGGAFSGLVECQYGDGMGIDLYPDIICSGYIPTNNEVLFPNQCWNKDSLYFRYIPQIPYEYIAEYFTYETIEIMVAPHKYDYFSGVNSNDCIYNIYPNPTSDFLNIDKKQFIPMEIELFDIQGNLIFSDKVSHQSYKINMQCFATGIYILTIKDGGSTTNHKIVKTN